MTIDRLTELQTDRGATFKVSEASMKTYAFILKECRQYISERSELYRNLDIGRKDKIKELILAFVNMNKYMIEGCTTEDGTLDAPLLTEKLVASIQDYDILTDAMNDPEVLEIRGNGREIKIEKGGRCTDLRDVNGNIVRFNSAEQNDTILRKMLGDKRLSPKYAIVNASTIEGYRLAAVHSSTTGDDPDDAPGADKYHSFVLRKFKKNKMDLGDIARKETLSDNMARLLALFMRGNLTFFTCGPTASGKSTTNNAIIQYCPPNKRLVLLQNPSEIDARFKDSYGRTYNDVLHLEYIEKDEASASPSDPTKENMMAHILRLSPNFIVFGEWREDKEFKIGLKLGESGHPLNSTLHAQNSEGAFQRILNAYLSASGNETPELAVATIAGIVDFIIIQHIMSDGRRRVLQITEVEGVNPDNKSAPLLNDIYVFEKTGKAIYNKDGTVAEMPGKHKRVGKLSKRTIKKLELAGVNEEQYEFLLSDPEVDIEEEYTGENIRNFGMHLEDID